MSTHALLSPSKRHRWQKCPGSIREEARYPEAGKAGPAAIEGTHSHTVLESCIRTGLWSATQIVGTTLEDHEGRFIVNVAQAERVNVALKYIQDRTHGMPHTVVKSEEKVSPFALTGRMDLDGTVDIQIIEPELLEIIDYKDGMDPVSVIDNPQLEQYAIGVLAQYVQSAIPFKHVQMTIIQPKMALKGLPPVTSHMLTIEEVMSKCQQLILEAAATDDPEAPLVPGEKQCKWCPHAGNCSAAFNDTMKRSGVEFKNIAQDAGSKDPHSLTDAQLREIIEAAPMLRKLLSEAESEALSRMEKGVPIEGLKLVRGRGSRAWALTDEEIEAKLKKMGVPKGSIWEISLISPAKTEKLVWAKRDGTTKQLSPRQLELMNKEMIRKSEGKLTVASVADERPAVDVFDASKMAQNDAPPSWLS